VTRLRSSVLDSVDPLDPVYETDCRAGFSSGETDTMGYPEYNAIVGGVVSHFDEV